MSSRGDKARLCGGAVMGCTLVGCIYGGTPCSYDSISLEPPQPGEHSLAFHVLGERGDDYEYHGSFVGSSSNLSTQACAFAIYEFDEPPDRQTIAPVIVGETPPDTVAGGGRLLDHGVLPARGDNVFEVPFDRRLHDYSTVPGPEKTFVFTFCSGATVDVDIELHLFMCADTESLIPRATDLMEQLW